MNDDEVDEYVQEGLRDNEEVNDFHDFLPRTNTAEQKRQSIVNVFSNNQHFCVFAICDMQEKTSFSIEMAYLVFPDLEGMLM